MVAKPAMNTSYRSPNKGGYSSARKVESICWHVTVGSALSSIGWLCNPNSNASSNYLIDRAGIIYELVPPTESAWANGAVNKPDMGNPVIANWITTPVNPNTRTVSVEHERLTSANEQPGGFTEAQHKSTVALGAWLCQQFGIPPDRTHIIRHAQIDSVNRQHCPGLAESEMVAWIGEIAALVHGGGPQGEGIAYRVAPDGSAELVINYGGTAVRVDGVSVVDCGITVINAAGERYSRSVKANAFEPWVKEQP